jgi:hypothetical protein
MRNYPRFLRKRLLSKIHQLELSECVKNPEKDFTRKRKLPFAAVVQQLVSMGGNTLYKELLEAYGFQKEVATSSAFVQQRCKVLPTAFSQLLRNFSLSPMEVKRYKGYRLLAVDGSDLTIPADSQDVETLQKNQYTTFNLLHLNVLYDLTNRVYLDAELQPLRKKDERQALRNMVDRSPITANVIVLADRGYESYNCFDHISKKGWNYIIRVKDVRSSGILSGLSLPDGVFDVVVHRLLTRRQTLETKSELYRFMPKNQVFDALPVGSKETYPFSFRVVRFMLDNGDFACVITNLYDVSPAQLKALYSKRWGIETSFRTLKYTIGLVNFHAKKRELIAQEVFARLVMYNFCEMITAHVVISQPSGKYVYRANFTVAVHICRRYLRPWGNAPPLDVEALISRNITPIKPNRMFARCSHTKSGTCFIYRIA